MVIDGVASQGGRKRSKGERPTCSCMLELEYQDQCICYHLF